MTIPALVLAACPACKSHKVQTLLTTDKNMLMNCNNCDVGYWIPIQASVKSPTKPKDFENNSAIHTPKALICDNCAHNELTLIAILAEPGQPSTITFECVNCHELKTVPTDTVLA